MIERHKVKSAAKKRQECRINQLSCLFCYQEQSRFNSISTLFCIRIIFLETCYLLAIADAAVKNRFLLRRVKGFVL